MPVRPRAATAKPVDPQFSPDTLKFLKALGFHQNKAWFEENRALYESAVRAPMLATIAATAEAFAKKGIPFTGEPRTAMMRIHRDVRFARDKRPYNTHAAMMLTRDGSRQSRGRFYLGIEADEIVMAAGFWQPEPADLAAFRRAIAARPARFLAMQAALKKGKLALDASETLTRNPSGYPDPDPRIEKALRLKSFYTRRTLEPEDVFDRGRLVKALCAYAMDTLPLHVFGWQVLE